MNLNYYLFDCIVEDKGIGKQVHKANMGTEENFTVRNFVFCAVRLMEPRTSHVED